MSWLHVDMNSYFASVEQQANPFLRGRPVGVCAYLNDYGCIIASSIEAKQRGVKTGMRVPEARRLCPKIVLVENDPKKYRSTTKAIFSIFTDYTDQIEPYSIDEAFLRFPECHSHEGGNPDNYSGSRIHRQGGTGKSGMIAVAQEMKQRIKFEVGDWLRCSIGIASTRWLAKVGSDFQKPDGLTIVTPETLPSMYDRMKLTDAWGIGDRLEVRLNRLGIYTLNELRTYPVANLMEVMGIRGYELWANVNGIEYNPNTANTTNDAPKSIGHSYCLPRSVQDPVNAQKVLMKLCEKTARRLRDDGRQAWTVSCAWSTALGGDSRRKQCQTPIWKTEELFRETLQMMNEAFTHSVQFLAISVMNLRPPSGQLSLWNVESNSKDNTVTTAMDIINNRYGEYTLIRGAMWGMQEFVHDRIGFRKSVALKHSTTER